MTTKFYTYSQNNSGGSFTISEERGICEYVIIEAANAGQANARAEEIGLYFYGCEDGYDCPCCGDRWHPAFESSGSDVPSICGEPVENVQKDIFINRCFIHYLDGTIKKVGFFESAKML